MGLPLGASVPPLGLSNKAVYTGEIPPLLFLFLLSCVEDRVEERPRSTTAGVKTNIFTEPELPSFEAVSLKGGYHGILDHVMSCVHYSSTM